jgi:hypothetical protein
MEKSLKLIENSRSVSLARIDFDGFSRSNRWIGYAEPYKKDRTAIEISCAMFEKFFGDFKNDFWVISALEYDDARSSNNRYFYYFQEYRLGKRLGFFLPYSQEFEELDDWEEFTPYESLILTFDSDLYMPFAKVMLDMVFNLVVGQTFFLINPKLQIAVYPYEDASFGVISLNGDPTIGVEFLKFFEQDPLFEVYFDDGVFEDYERRKVQSSEAMQWNFPKEWHRSASFFNDRQTHRRKEMELIKEKIKKNTLIKCIPLKRICFNDLRQSQCWVGSFSAKHQDVKEIENAMQLMQDFFASKTDDFFVLSALAYENKTPQVSLDEEILYRYEQAKQTGFLQPLTDEFLSWIQGRSQFLYQFINFTFNAEYYVPFVKMMMYLKPHQLVVGDLCVLISPKLQVALYPHDDIGFGVIALDDDPTLGVEFLRFCEKDERFSVHIDADVLKEGV